MSRNSKHAGRKEQTLEAYLSELGNVMVAFSSGVDSTFLLKTAHDLLGEKAVAVTARSCSFPQRVVKIPETVVISANGSCFPNSESKN